MKESSIQYLKIQLEEAVQMLRLVAQQKRTCLEVQEWLDHNHPEADDSEGKPIMDLLLKSSAKNAK